MQQVDLAAAQHFLSHFSDPFFGEKLLYDYGLRDAPYLHIGKALSPIS
jgi:hypothetical protein